jgi:hypothetical protein
METWEFGREECNAHGFYLLAVICGGTLQCTTDPTIVALHMQRNGTDAVTSHCLLPETRRRRVYAQTKLRRTPLVKRLESPMSRMIVGASSDFTVRLLRSKEACKCVVFPYPVPHAQDLSHWELGEPETWYGNSRLNVLIHDRGMSLSLCRAVVYSDTLIIHVKASRDSTSPGAASNRQSRYDKI